MTQKKNEQAMSPASDKANTLAEVEMAKPLSGWIGIAITLIAFAASAAFFIKGSALGAGVAVVLGITVWVGTVTLEPNSAVVLVLFGEYRATLRQDGYFWINPLFKRIKISLRTQNFSTPTLKVNDLMGNPIDVAAVVTWRVVDTAKAVFEIEHYDSYVQIQSETGLREVAGSAAYDGHDAQFTLRGNFKEVAERLKTTIQSHLEVAGVEVQEAKLMHLAYSAEIASVMLRRQQAEAIVQSREKMVEGAIGMVKMTVDRMKSEGIAEMTQTQTATLVTSMMTVLLSESGAQPVVPTQLGS
jgi:regulator of protease activity HflC (stomatin/prohibitin superfamily)